MKKAFTPEHTWTRIARAMTVYPGEWDAEFYKLLLSKMDEVKHAIAEIQADGHNMVDAMGWCFELCGTFEITHPDYMPPAGYRHPSSEVLYRLMHKIFGM